SINFERIVAIVEEIVGESGVEVDAGLLDTSQTTVPDIPEFTSNGSRATSELVGAGLSCGFAIVAGIGVLGGAAAEVPTAGTSTVLVVAAWVGFASSGLQCLNGIARSVEALRNPDQNSLQQWDNNTIYSTATLIVDIIGVASAAASLPAATRNLLAVLERRGGLAALKLSALNKVERQAAMKEAIEKATRTPEGQKELVDALRKAGLSEKQAAQTIAHSAKSARRAGVALRAITEITASRLHMHLLSALSGGLTPLVSATPSRVTGSASGSVNSLIVHIINLASNAKN
ncbi:MAG: hypothetical protein JO331_03125, partial [Verrucomicrobia bacterium]|nr:hypothetical protein [Verrucomicrobiota bacterium]